LKSILLPQYVHLSDSISSALNFLPQFGHVYMKHYPNYDSFTNQETYICRKALINLPPKG